MVNRSVPGQKQPFATLIITIAGRLFMRSYKEQLIALHFSVRLLLVLFKNRVFTHHLIQFFNHIGAEKYIVLFTSILFSSPERSIYSMSGPIFQYVTEINTFSDIFSRSGYLPWQKNPLYDFTNDKYRISLSFCLFSSWI